MVVDRGGDMGQGWQLLGSIAAIGAITMAILQLIDEFTPLRQRLQADWIRNWLKRRAEEYQQAAAGRAAPSVAASLPQSIDAEAALALLVAHATGGDSNALFRLPTAQLVAQISAAAQIAIEHPDANYQLLAALAQTTKPSVSPTLFAAPVALTQPTTDADMDDLSVLLAHRGTAGAVGAGDKYLDARGRVMHRVQRNLDSIQILLATESGRVLQVLAIAVGIVIAVSSSVDNGFLVGVAAGYLAPLIADVVAAIRRLGRT